MASESTSKSDQRRPTDSPVQWAQVVKGCDGQSESSITHKTEDGGNASASNAVIVDDAAIAVSVTPKKPAWNNSCNGGIDGGSSSNGGEGIIMGADSWPALSESTRVSNKSAASVAHYSTSKSMTNGSASTSEKQGVWPGENSNAPQSSTHPGLGPVHSSRTRPIKRDGAVNHGPGPVLGSFAYNHGPPQPFTLPPYPVYPVPADGYGFVAQPLPPLPDALQRDLQYRGGYRGARPVGGFPSQGGNDRRGSGRRGNFDSHSRGDGSFNNNNNNNNHGSFNNYNNNNNNHGSFNNNNRGNGNARDFHGPNPQGGPPRGYLRLPPPYLPPFIPAQNVGPFPYPRGYRIPDYQYYSQLSLDPYRGQMVPQNHPANMLSLEPLSTLVLRQIEYYFSDENLIKDTYLKSRMDGQGWVPVSLIANFPRVRQLMGNVNQTNNVVDSIILDSLRPSSSVEVQDAKLRRRTEWIKWVNSSSGIPLATGLKSSFGGEASSSYMLVGEASSSLLLVREANSSHTPVGEASSSHEGS